MRPRQISKLYAQTVAAEQNNKAIEDSLTYIESQQAELAKLLDGYEGQANEMYESTVGAARGSGGGSSSSSAALVLASGGGGGGGGNLEYGPADQERERSYALAESLHGQLDALAGSLASMIGTVNSLTAANGGAGSAPTVSSKAVEGTGEPTTTTAATIGAGGGSPAGAADEDPIGQISQILDAHLKSLQWIDGASDGLRARVGEVERRLVDASGGGGAAGGGGGGIAQGMLQGSRLGTSTQPGGVGGGGRFGLSRRG